MTSELDETQHYSYAINIVTEGIKSILLVNGGAATALIALTDNEGANFNLSVLLFAFGAISAACCFFTAYFSQLSFTNHLAMLPHDPMSSKNNFGNHVRFQYASMVLIVVSIAFALGGASTALWANANSLRVACSDRTLSNQVAPPPPSKVR